MKIEGKNPGSILKIQVKNLNFISLRLPKFETKFKSFFINESIKKFDDTEIISRAAIDHHLQKCFAKKGVDELEKQKVNKNLADLKDFEKKKLKNFAQFSFMFLFLKSLYFSDIFEES